MKKLIGIVLALTIVFGSSLNVSAAVVKGSNNRTYITLDKTEIKENKLVLREYFNIKKFKVNVTKNNYTVTYKSNKSSKATKMQVKKVASKLHGVNIEKQFKEYRTYKIKVVGIDRNGNRHVKIMNGHKII